MRFYGNGVVWDAENDRRLCKFSRAARGEKGVFDTDDKRIQAILIERGYPRDVSREVVDVTPPGAEWAEYAPAPVTPDLGAKKLREIGKELGLSFPASMKKTEMAAKINEAMK